LNETDSSPLPEDDIHFGDAEEDHDDYMLEFEFKKDIWYQTLIISFKENEDLGRVDPIEIKMQNFIL
jgi:hypothetical protein